MYRQVGHGVKQRHGTLRFLAKECERLALRLAERGLALSVRNNTGSGCVLSELSFETVFEGTTLDCSLEASAST